MLFTVSCNFHQFGTPTTYVKTWLVGYVKHDIERLAWFLEILLSDSLFELLRNTESQSSGKSGFACSGYLTCIFKKYDRVLKEGGIFNS